MATTERLAKRENGYDVILGSALIGRVERHTLRETVTSGALAIGYVYHERWIPYSGTTRLVCSGFRLRRDAVDFLIKRQQEVK
jgi:hypothetical protein